MNKYHTQTLISPLLLVLFFCSSCNGQVETKTAVASVNTGVPTAIVQTLLKKHHSSNPLQAAADNVHCGLQDKAGNLWFGTTADGVYRYDGKFFTNFTMKDGLDTNQVLCMLEDKKGNIWFGSRRGICRYDGKTISKMPITGIKQQQFYPVLSLNNNPPAQNAVWSMMQDNMGMIWFGTDEGVYCFDGKTFSRFLNAPNIINQTGLTLKSVQSMLQDSKGNIWFGSGPMAFEGICLYDGKKLNNYKPRDQQWIRKIVETKTGVILFATRSAGILYYDPIPGQTDSLSFNSFPAAPGLINGSLTNIMEDKAGMVWVASDYVRHPSDSLGGIWHTNFSTGKITEKPFTKITNKPVFFMLQDKDSNIWLGTRSTGLYRFDGKTVTLFSE